MGGGGSKPAPQPTVIERPPPAGSEKANIVYSFSATEPRLDGLTRTLANDCPGCTLRISAGVSGSSVKITRQFGTANYKQCSSYDRDLKLTKDKKMSWMDFMNNLEAGNYMRDLGNGYCEEINTTPEDAMKVKSGGEYKEDIIRTVRIRKQGF